MGTASVGWEPCHMTINVTPSAAGQVIRIFTLPVVREVRLPAAPVGTAW